MKPRISESWRTLSRRTGLPGSSISSITLMNEQPSKSSRANHSPKMSKIASRRCAGVVGATLDRVLQPLARPALLAALEEGEDEVVLGREVAIERHLRHARLGDDPVDADRPRAVLAEQLVGGLEHALAAAVAPRRWHVLPRSSCGDGTDLSRRLPGHPASTAADRHAPTSSITAGTSSSATTSWIFGAARAARSRTRCARWARASAASAAERRRQRRAVALGAAERGDQRGDAVDRAAPREPLERLRVRDAERRPRGGGAQLGRERTAAPAPDLAQRAQRRQPGAHRDAQEVEDVGQLGRHRGAPAPRARARSHASGARKAPAGAASDGDRPEPAGQHRGERQRGGERDQRRAALERHDVGDASPSAARPPRRAGGARSRGAAGHAGAPAEPRQQPRTSRAPPAPRRAGRDVGVRRRAAAADARRPGAPRRARRWPRRRRSRRRRRARSARVTRPPPRARCGRSSTQASELADGRGAEQPRRERRAQQRERRSRGRPARPAPRRRRAAARRATP